MTNNIMIDIETLSLDNAKAVILSVGMVSFELHEDGPEIYDEQCIVLELGPQIAAGRKIDPGTLKFWQEQSPEARRHWAEPITTLVHPDDLLAKIESFMMSNEAMGAQVWARGVVFDIGNLLDIFGAPPPWKYNAVRDVRTVTGFCGVVRDRKALPLAISGAAHDPVFDCKEQIVQVWEHWA